jgi:hypothetical protein
MPKSAVIFSSRVTAFLRQESIFVIRQDMTEARLVTWPVQDHIGNKVTELQLLAVK